MKYKQDYTLFVFVVGTTIGYVTNGYRKNRVLP